MDKIKKTIIIFKEDISMKEIERYRKLWNCKKDIMIGGDFEIWEKDLETGRIVQLK